MDVPAGARAAALLERHAAWALGAFLLLVYLLSSPPGLTFEDASTFASACATYGLPHPPGYPAWVLGCQPFRLLPLEPVRAAGAMSSVAAAAACALLYVVLRRQGLGLPASLLAAGALGLGPSFWGQAIIPEAYALNVLLLAASLLLAQQWMRTRACSALITLALVTGLGLANHWPLYVLTWPALLPWLLAAPRALGRTLRRPLTLLRCVLAFGLGLLPYLHLYTVSPDAFLFYPTYEHAKWFDYVRRELYVGTALDLAAGPRLAAMAAAAASFVPQYGWLLGLPVLHGLWLLARREPRMMMGCLWGMLATTALLAWARPYDLSSAYSSAAFSVYMLPAYLFAALPLAQSLEALARRLRRAAAARWLPAGAAAALLLLAAAHWPLASRRGEDVAGPHARLVLASLPPDALLLMPLGDSGAIYRYAALAAERDDLRLARVFDYARSPNGRRFLSEREMVAKFDAEEGPVALTQPFRIEGVGQEFYGLHYVYGPALPAGALEPRLSPAARAHLRVLAAARAAEPRSYHTAAFLDAQLRNATESLLRAARRPAAALATEDRALLDELLADPAGQAALLEVLVKNEPRGTVAEAEAAHAAAVAGFSKMRPLLRARVHHMLALGHLNANDLPSARAALEDALAAMPSVFNSEVIKELLVLHFKMDAPEAYAELRAAYRLPRPGRLVATADEWCARRLGRPCGAR